MRTAFVKSQSSITQGGRPEANPQYANDVLKVKLTSRMIRFKASGEKNRDFNQIHEDHR